MSSCERLRGRRRVMAACGVGLAAAFLGGCQVRPLYAAYASPHRTTASIAVDPVNTRVGQQVRNHLLFLMDRGGGEPAAPAYSLSLSVSASEIGIFVGSSVDSSPTAGKERVTVAYVLKDAGTGKPLKTGRRTAVAAFDLPPQEFTKLRAVRDAENRAAISAAELVNGDLAGYLAR